MTLADDVYAVVRLVPRGRVVCYGDLAELFGVGPRMVGRVMAGLDEPDVPWWRVVRADGGMDPHVIEQAREHWLAEGIATTDRGVRIRLHHADLAQLADAAERLLGPLPGAGDVAPVF